MTSVIYASVGAFLIVWLSLYVIKVRHNQQISLGDGDNSQLITAMAAQSNALEYIPISLILLFSLEYNNGPLWLIHALGISLLIGRVIHAKAILSENLELRVTGMKITIWVIILLASCNIIFLPYKNFLSI